MVKEVDNIKIRMYRQGLGDCFLLKFCNKEKSLFNMMIDCGVLLGTENSDQKMKDIVKHIADDTENKIDVVMVTHEHWDHVSGFIQAQEEFDKIDIGEIWLSWAENPNDSFAKILKKDKNLKLQLLQDILHAKKHTNRFHLAEQALSFFAASEGKKTSDAMKYIQEKGKSNINYFEPGEVISVDALPNIRFYVLGPPKDEKLIKKNMSSNSDVIYKLGIGNDFLNPFAEFDRNQNKSLFDEKYVLLDNRDEIENIYNGKDVRWKKIEDEYLDMANNMALALDSNTNNTSFVLAIESLTSGKILLFTGDAQVGNWLSWSNLNFEKEGIKGKKTINSEDILSRTVFYKTGHHGSHNATIKNQGLEMMSDDLEVMIPVDRKMAAKKKWEMPAETLWKAIKEKTSSKIIILDEDNIKKTSAGNKNPIAKRKDFLDRVISNKIYHELKIDV